MEVEISILGMSFISPLGLWPEERKIGTRVEVDVIVVVDKIEDEDWEDLNTTVDYQYVYKIVEEVLREENLLIEAVAKKILHKIFQVKIIKTIQVTVHKLNPPVGGNCRESSVKISKSKCI